ncbi:DUF4358 domain-containing protein [Eubacteriales bacterium OttesenSCG-928-M02]|nr:DUF4358 domain-containing protein [Eubacteriales bacterium OttesenSCG-928-M02]
MKRNMLFSILMAVLVLAVCACGTSQGATPDYDKAVKSITEKMQKELSDGGVEITAENPLPMYMVSDVTKDDLSLTLVPDLDPAWVDRGTIIQAGVIINANLIMLVEAKDAESAKKVAAEFKKAKASQERTWSTYLPDQYKKVQENITATKGNLVYYITYEKPAEIEKLILD